MKAKVKAIIAYHGPEIPWPGSLKERLGGKSYLTIPVMFNPTDITDSLSISYSDDKCGKTPRFNETSRDDLSLNLFYDASEEATQELRNVKLKTIVIKMLAQPVINPQHPKTPPVFTFLYGAFYSFTGYITKYSEKFTLFDSFGTPMRAEVSITMKEFLTDAEAKKLNNTTNSRKFWTVKEGDRLDLIAGQVFQDSTLWRPIADENNIEDPLNFPLDEQVGTVLAIPEIGVSA